MTSVTLTSKQKQACLHVCYSVRFNMYSIVHNGELYIITYVIHEMKMQGIHGRGYLIL